jgi:micrococcal nuclease
MRLRKRFSLWAIAVVVALTGLLTLPAEGDPSPAPASEQSSAKSGGAERPAPTRQIRVIDGDTIRDLASDITYRIVNIDTPETGARARCLAERELGDRATHQARTLITEAEVVDVRPTGRTDRYGRAIAFVVVDGRDLGETLIAAGLARPWRGRREPWCDEGGNLIL